ncbi:phage tail protein [Methylomonas sp. EFPC1]|nr:phage tail protein [Methylomonas sp. EFPC1]
MLLVDGNGYIWGRWVIQSIDEEQMVFFGDGTPRKQAFSMQITPYGEDL